MMQKEIFDDLAWQHEAYMLGGAALMQDIHRRHPDEIDARTLVAWEDIASGDPDRVKPRATSTSCGASRSR